MSGRLAVVLAAVSALLATSPGLPMAAAAVRGADRPPTSSPLTVELDEAEVTVGPGQKVRFTSTVRNVGNQPVSDLVAHVAILTSDEDVYVDPEDWSPRRTQFVDRLDADEETALTWSVQAVTAGPVILYVAVTDPQSDTVAVSGPLYMTVTGQREVNSADALPLVTIVPAAVLLLLGLTGVRRRMRR